MTVKNTLKIATILDNKLYTNLEYECNLINLKHSNWREKITTQKPDFLLVESLTKNLEWYKEVVDINSNNSILKELTKFCDSNNIPTVFWNTASSQAFDSYINASKLFKYVFTAHSDTIEKYKSLLDHNNIFKLDYAIQPKLFNPHHVNNSKIGDIYCEIDYFDEETSKLILSLASTYTIHFYSNNNIKDFNLKSNLNTVIENNFKGTIHKNKGTILKKYYVSLIFSSNTINVTQNIYESQASGINTIISGLDTDKNTSIKSIYLHKNIQLTKDYINKLKTNAYFRNKKSLLGYRELFYNYTYAHRLKKICDNIGIIYPKEIFPSVSFVACTNKINSMQHVLENYNRQNYPSKELIVILNNNKISIEEWLSASKEYYNIKIYQLDEEKTLGECLNYGIKQSSGSIIAKIDDDDYYGEHYTIDAINAFKYTQASVVGKARFYTYFTKRKQLVITHNNNYENSYSNYLSGSTLVVKRTVFNKIPFVSIKTNGTDTHFLYSCKANNLYMYSINTYNYICYRNSLQQHTWKIEDRELLRYCLPIETTENYIQEKCF